MTQRFVTSALLAAVVLAGCSKKDKDKDKAPPAEPGSGSAMANTPPPAPPPTPPAGSGSASAAPAGSDTAPAAPTGSVAKLADMVKITFPNPPKAPADAKWVIASDTNVDGKRQEAFTAADKNVWLTVGLFDCRTKDAASQPLGEWCAKKGDGKIKNFDRLTDPDSLSHGVRAGNMVIVAGPTVPVKDKFTDADTDAWLGSLDLDAIAKL